MTGFRPLPHAPGAWGIITDDAKLKPGQAVAITTKSGNVRQVTLGDLLYTRNGVRVFTQVM